MTSPPRPSVWFRALLVLCALKIALLIVTFDPSGLIAFDLPKSLASRATACPIAIVLAILLIEHGRSIVPRSRLHVAVVGVVATWLIAATVAQDRYLALFGEDDRYLGLTYLADMTILYVACAVAVRDVRDAKLLFAAIAIGAAVSLGYAGAQAIGADPFWWQDAPATRPFSTFGNPDHFGHFLSVLFGLSFGAAVAARGVVGIATGALGVGASLAAASIVATRGTALGIIASVVVAPIAARARWRAVVGSAVIWLALVAIFTTTPLGERVRATLAGAQMEDRATVYAASLRAFAARPIAGYGPDNFRIAYAQHRPSPAEVPSATTPQSSAHNWILDAAVMTGSLGLIALLALVVVGTVDLIALARRLPGVGLPLLLCWCAYWAHALVAVGSIAIGWVPPVALGVAVGLGPRAPLQRIRRVPRWASALALIATIVVAATGARVFLANRDALVMEHASAVGDARGALVAAESAVTRDSARAENWNRLGIALDGLELWRASLDAYREAAARRPYEPIYWANVARSHARLALAGDAGAREAAIAAARRAVDADPNSAVAHSVLSEIATAFGMCDLARSEAAIAATFGRTDLVARAAACR
ncbi:MAG TPA: O-antigen ligase family protein [Candidatus Limnocylindria bacterium]|nr:O-antigen ligase family protein [Candidatus Limnocylindria bacterium]